MSKFRRRLDKADSYSSRLLTVELVRGYMEE